MSNEPPVRRPRRAVARATAGLVILAGAIIATTTVQSTLSSGSSPSPSPSPSLSSSPASPSPPGAPPVGHVGSDDVLTEADGVLPEADGVLTEADGALTEADGVLPDGVTVFAADYPGVSRLDADLLHAVRLAATDAADDGIELLVNSGWRSPEYQRRLLRDAVAEYGSEDEAARWVATADTSAHVSGDAVDIGPFESAAWLGEHGATYGLCQIYANEPWHFELRPEAIDGGCPPVYADPTHDPRMQR